MGRRKHKNNKRGRQHHPSLGTDQDQQQRSSKGNKSGRNGKRQKRERFWIEDCRDTPMPSGDRGRDDSDDDKRKVLSLELLVTRSELVDDYRQVPNPTKITTCEDDDSNSNDEKGQSSAIEGNSNMASPATTNDPVSFRSQKSSFKDDDDHDEEEDSSNKKQSIEKETQDEIQLEERDTDEELVAARTDKEVDGNDKNNNKDDDRNNKDDACANAFICVKRANNAKRPINIIGDSVEDFDPLPNGDCGDGIVNPFPKDEVGDKFWSQRRRLFSLFDDGIQLDKESWYSVTPEAIANHIAAHLTSAKNNLTILDPFCGCGGNASKYALMMLLLLLL
jgi:hypothetical protein